MTLTKIVVTVAGTKREVITAHNYRQALSDTAALLADPSILQPAVVAELSRVFRGLSNGSITVLY